ncbi:hypothetical protein Kpol_364p10 [Vanderwaltozyma polyspora DSM 70294]|uniref:Spore wall maturation protein DIT1 n=1 Tax=Vanderwaltozyma polyspora (strain ATCC 22028 / DSM 70294 / BCRC 21397 / CBS 2163 / NBRC 10782 / NRRL Y-8283 / UCD 57-17) TaxID=436907 RepID=A7TSC6_VANPO|nr:uncharacterized protein Kpol_364p10 [Vanderwaltozyma polyspora DSM 70294]EDO14838.1 hypothetical protein Kpol_364p10 [Vanderwaltozyma polyspora DSM 70294]
MTITKQPTYGSDSLPVLSGNPSEIPDNFIPHKRNDLSTFSKVLGLYSRDPETYELFSCEEKQDCQFVKNWEKMKSLLKSTNSEPNNLIGKVSEYVIDAGDADVFTNNMGLKIKVSEYKCNDETQIRGAITTMENENAFNDWFIYHVLDQARLKNNDKPINNDPKMNKHILFTEFFEKEMKNTIANDQWEFGGSDYFISRVRYFTDRNITIEAVLPAFPCKSSNVDKVGGNVPDKGEELALRRLMKFAKDVRSFYEPGMKIWIVSDGHVFSDCIGVDDDIVNSYTYKLRKLYENIAEKDLDLIGFCGLNDLFFKGETASLFNPSWVQDVIVDHYTGSKICPISDLARQVLMKGCDTDDGRLKKHINIDGHPRLNLYRGFSKFMSEDLSLLPFFEKSSRKKFKKNVSKIAFNMIKRNDAYSNLVELVFPHHLRLSIHAHTNQGPKFGIKVISQDQCKIVSSLEDEVEPTFEDLLHIPTPWHNCVVKYENYSSSKEVSPVTSESSASNNSESSATSEENEYNEKEANSVYFLTKSKIVKDAIAKGIYEGNWKETSVETGEGGHYVIYKRY